MHHVACWMFGLLLFAPAVLAVAAVVIMTAAVERPVIVPIPAAQSLLAPLLPVTKKSKYKFSLYKDSF